MNDQPGEALFLFTKENHDASIDAALLEQYKLYVQSAENVSARRVASSRYLLTVNAALVALYGFQSQLLEPLLLNVLVPLPGILVSLLWYRVIASHRDLNAVKFEIIHELERKLPAALYTYEWRLADGGRGKRYRSVTDIERWVPLIFLAVHLVPLVVLAWNSLSDRPA